MNAKKFNCFVKRLVSFSLYLVITLLVPWTVLFTGKVLYYQIISLFHGGKKLYQLKVDFTDGTSDVQRVWLYDFETVAH